MKKRWNGFEHQIWKNLSDQGLAEHKSFLLAVSGGLDSMVLLAVMQTLKPQARLKVFHYHHGPTPNAELSVFRSQCRDLVSSEASPQIEFLTAESSVELRSEDEAREARWSAIGVVQQPEDIVVTAHHLDDRLETVLLKLIRGTSIEGISAFQMWNQKILRPFLNLSRAELKKYAEEKQIKWCEDPTNQESDYLRNWLRNQWLPALDEKVTGGRDNLSRSILRIADSQGATSTFEQTFAANAQGGSVARAWFSFLSKNDQIRALALLLKKQNIHDFTTGQLEEIRKRLDKNQKDLTFEILERKWVINATHIVIE
jgi:tRNA(Ile)-lysidine synthase